jgi:hypothetical protein
MLDKAKLGSRYTCFKCGTKFYDLNRPVPSCPECSADQREAPARDIRALLGKGGPVRKYADEEEELDAVEGEGEDDEMGLGMGLDEEDDDDDVEMEDDEEMMEEGGGGGGEEED